MIIKWLQRGLLAVIVVVSLYASIQNLIATKDLGSLTDDPVADFSKRFDPLKAKLPFKVGAVGYISDSSIPGIQYNAANDEGEYTLTQYVMSPIVIVKGTNQEWNIALLTPTAYKVWSKSNNGQFEVFAFKGNLYLLHRLSK